MSLLVFVALVGVCVLALVALVAALHLLDKHEQRRSRRLQDIVQSLPSPYSNQSELKHESSLHHNGEILSRFCHSCGNITSRRPHGTDVTTSISDVVYKATCNQIRPWQHLMAVRDKVAASSKYALERFSSFQKGPNQVTTDLRRRLVSFESALRERGLRKEGELKTNKTNLPFSNVLSCHSKDRGKVTPATSAVSPVGKRNGDTSLNVMGAGRPSVGVLESVAGPMTGPSYDSTSLSSGLPATISFKNNFMESKSLPLRRLVLEILMSPSADREKSKEGTGSSSCASGVRLKLETNGSLEHLASATTTSDLAFEIGDFRQAEQKSEEEAGVNLLGVPAEVMPITKETVSKLELQIPTRKVSREGCMCGSSPTSITNSLPKAGVPSVELPCAEASSDNSMGLLDDVGSNKCLLLKAKALSTKPAESTGSPPLEDTDSAVLKFPTYMNGVADAFVQLKITTPSSGCNSVESVSGLRLGGVERRQHLERCQDPAPFTSSDGLGSLRVTFLKGCTDGQISKECIKEVSAQVASALAALNIVSVCERGVGAGVGFATDINRDGLKNCHDAEHSHSSVTAYQSHDDGVQSEGHESEHGIDFGDKRAISRASKHEGCEDDDVDPKKKEKKKKKNRAKRQKSKGLPSAIEAQEHRELGKIVLEAAKHVSAASKSEVGCVCGTPKGGFHSNSCPYPFTSSGSMLQRKIKEQYDELVRSNAAKTLTLAQVGRFTTCLVETKAALQQKSEVIQRRFTIARSLLAKADKSSFDRLCGQIYGLEVEQKKLEEDTVVYNRLQEQLKLSPAYQKMLEYGRAHFELQPRTGQIIEKLEAEDMDISFEELLAQEKKDAFWKKHGLPRSSVQVI